MHELTRCRATLISLLACASSCGTADDEPAIEPGVVEVFVDAQGVPHLFAPSDASLLWASGHLQAEARLAQMELLRRGSRAATSRCRLPAPTWKIGRSRVGGSRSPRTGGEGRFRGSRVRL
ncbi:MAG TPA: penicillin acylase family protein [Enhygromyxa sp.]|nr:penicillin acylase family protein [Enhygromyxa sp.]